jgi:choline dehydrogenase
LNLFSDPSDFEIARRGIRTARRIFATRPQADIIAHETRPGAAVQSDAEIDAYVRQTSQVTQHPVGTCSMGIGADAVVDPQLRVRGMEGLRVVDASVMPTVPGANTNAAVVMIAEKATEAVEA